MGGYRMVAYKDGDQVRLVSRQGMDFTRRFVELATAIKALRYHTPILDGEVARYDEELVSRFEWLRESPKDEVATPPMFMAFDPLQLDERDRPCSYPILTRVRHLSHGPGNQTGREEAPGNA